jgi:hypothetical protein
VMAERDCGPAGHGERGGRQVAPSRIVVRTHRGRAGGPNDDPRIEWTDRWSVRMLKWRAGIPHRKASSSAGL